MAEAWDKKIKELYASMQGPEGKRWARPEEPILHTLPDEKAEPHIFFHNTNYRTSRKYINAEKVKVRTEAGQGCCWSGHRMGCSRSARGRGEDGTRAPARVAVHEGAGPAWWRAHPPGAVAAVAAGAADPSRGGAGVRSEQRARQVAQVRRGEAVLA